MNSKKIIQSMDSGATIKCKLVVKKIALLFVFSWISFISNAQSVAINTDGSNSSSSAILDVKSIEKGILIPRMSRIEKNAILAPTEGLLIFQNAPDSVGFYYYTSGGWTWLLSNANADTLAWRPTGNIGTNATHFIGTTDNRNLVFKRNNIQAGFISTTNTSFGVDALNPLNTGVNNAAFGLQALLSNTTGIRNTAIGVRALDFNITGSNNTAIGMETLRRNEGNNNVAVGFRAMDTSTTGTNNVAVGTQALISNTTGSSNTAIGYRAIFSNKGGYNNSAVGQDALYKNTSGAFNAAFGVLSLTNNTTAFHNSAFGTQSLHDNVAGGQNTAVGWQSQFKDSSGSSNVAVGVQSLYQNRMGDNNTAVGRNAGYSTVGSGNVFLGYQAGQSETGSNKLYIANSAANPPLIYGDFALARLGISTLSPATKIDVHGDFKLGIVGTANNALLKATVNIDVPSIAANSEVDVTVTVTNANNSNSAVFVSPTADVEAGIVIAYARVSTFNTVKIRFRNTSGASIDPVAIDYVISVLQ